MIFIQRAINFGFTAIVLPISVTLIAVILLGCVDPFEGTAPDSADSPVVLSLKKEKAALIAQIQQIKATSEEETRRLRAENDARIESLKNELAAKNEDLREQIFPARTFHFAALGVVLLSGLIGWWRKETMTLFAGLLTAGCLIGIASIQRQYPWALQLLPACGVPLVIAYMIYSMRREKAVKILAQAIESDDNTKAVIKSDPTIAAFIETQVRRFLPQKGE